MCDIFAYWTYLLDSVVVFANVWYICIFDLSSSCGLGKCVIYLHIWPVFKLWSWQMCDIFAYLTCLQVVVLANVWYICIFDLSSSYGLGKCVIYLHIGPIFWTEWLSWQMCDIFAYLTCLQVVVLANVWYICILDLSSGLSGCLGKCVIYLHIWPVFELWSWQMCDIFAYWTYLLDWVVVLANVWYICILTCHLGLSEVNIILTMSHWQLLLLLAPQY